MTLTIAGFKAKASGGSGFFTPLSGIKGIDNATVSQAMGLDDAILEIDHAVDAGSNPAKYLKAKQTAYEELKTALDDKVAGIYDAFVKQGLTANKAQLLTMEKIKAEAKIGLAAIEARYPSTFGGNDILKSVFSKSGTAE